MVNVSRLFPGLVVALPKVFELMQVDRALESAGVNDYKIDLEKLQDNLKLI